MSAVLPLYRRPEQRLAWLGATSTGMVVMTAFVGALVIGTLFIAGFRLLWPDEYSTYLLANLPSWREVWAALLTGGDALPPFYYVIVRLSAALIPHDAVALRLPSLLGFLLASLCIFRFLAARMPAAFAAMGALFPAVTGAYYYAHEARSYALVLGFAALALRCWQRASSGERGVLGFALALAAATAFHYLAILVVVPFALAECLRTAATRRVDWRMWAAMAVSVVPILFAWPIIDAARAASGSSWTQAGASELRDFYVWLLLPAAVPLASAAVLVTVFAPSSRQKDDGPSARAPWGLKAHELAAAVGFLALPVAGLVVAKITGWFAGRYVLATVIGLAVLFTVAVYRLSDRNAVIAGVIAIIALGWFARTELHQFNLARKGHQTLQAEIALLAAQREDTLPIVAADPHTFGELTHYAPREIAERLAYLASAEKARQILGYTSIEIAMIRYIGPWTPANVVDFDAFIASKPRFLLYGDPGTYSWILPALQNLGWQIEFRARLPAGPQKDKLLFLVTRR